VGRSVNALADRHGAAYLLNMLALLLLACRVLPPRDDPKGVDDSAAPALATAFVGEGVALLAASRPLQADEAWDAEGARFTALSPTLTWAEGPGPYRLVTPGGALRGEAEEQVLKLSLPTGGLLLEPGEAASIEATLEGDSPLLQVSGLSFTGAEAGPAVEAASIRVEVADHPDRVLLSAPFTLVHTGQRSLWGDLHSHSNLSHDGCEDPDHDCLPRQESPALDVLLTAADRGLDFAALTEHAEWGAYLYAERGLEVPIWTEVQRLAAASVGGPVLALVGYEWTGAYEGGGHRTVFFDRVEVCADRYLGAQVETGDKVRANAVEAHRPSEGPFALTPRALKDALATPGACEAEAISYFHHSAYKMPRMVTWSAEANQGLDDRLVEIYSEHGSSECADPRAEHCDFGLNNEFFKADGSVQTALGLGLNLGFVGGTDNHDGRPGSVEDGGSGIYSNEGYKPHLTAGALSMVRLPFSQSLDHAAFFDALQARHTAAATLRLDTLSAALLCGGAVYLPGDDAPAGPCTLHAHIADEALSSVEIDVIDREGQASLLLPDAEGRLEAAVELPAEGLLYLRVRLLTTDGTEHRAWLSPWFTAP
jgi:hypothetical protein